MRSHALDERFLYSQSEVRRVHWHPTSLSHVLVLVSDNTIRLYNIALKSGPKLVRIFTTGPKPACQIAGRRILDSLGDTVVDFTPAPGSDCLLLLRGNGDVYVIEASLDAKSPVSPKLTGPLSMYPPADDNYGEDSCSITTVGQNPAVVVIATSSAILYHCLLLPGQDESEIIPEKRENSYALYVTEAVELNIEEQANNQQYQYSYPVHLYPLSENSNSYACVHFAGVHVVTLNIIEHLKDYLLAEEHEIETILSSLCLARSAARYMVRTRRPAAPRDPAAPIAPATPLAALAGLAAAPPPLPMLLVLAADGALVTRTLEPFDLEEQLYKELQLKNPALEQDDIQNILKERQKLSFSKIIQEMLTREVSQPILHTNKNEEPSPKESLEFVTQATLKLRQEYLARQARAGEAVRKKVAGLRALAARQDQWCEELKRELDEVQVESAVLREKCSIAEQHQDNLKLRCSSVVRAFSASSSASPAERELLRDLHSYRERSDEFNRQIQALKDRARVKEQQMKQWREDYKKKDIALGKSHSDTISSILQQQSHALDERFLYSQSEVRRVHWHPTSLSHVLVLVSDNTIRLYNIALKSGPKLVRIFTTGPKPACQIAGRRILDSLGDTVVDFTPAPGSDCLLLLRGNGDVYVIEASLDAKSPVSPKLTGPLSMYPPADDNYGEDSCSITTVGQNPAVVVIATSSAILYHCLLLPGQDESEIIPEKRENSFALYVTEAVELNIEEQATNQQYQYSYPVHLYPLSENSNSYACVHFAGVHVVTLNIIEHLKDYLLAEEHEIETILSSLCLARSAARYMVRTRRPAAPRDPTAPVAPTAPLAALAGLAAAPPPLPMLLVLAADGALVTRTLEPFDLEEQLYKELQLKNPALEQDDIQNILKERQKLSFSKVIQEMLTREVSQPILHTNKNEEPSPKESLEFVTQATLKLRQEYLARQARAGEAVRKKVAGLRALAARQDQWCEELKRELDEVQVESAVLREKCFIAEQHQDNLKLRCSSVVRAFSASSSASPAERELLRDLHSYRERSDEFNRQIQALKDRARVKEQQMKQWREDYKKKDIALGKSHSDTISSILQQQSHALDERFLYSQSEVRRVHWHPTSLSHVLVLVSDNTIRLYNIALKSGPKLVRIFTTGPKPACQIAGRRILDSLGDTVVDFTPAPGSDCLLLLRGNGDVYVIEASLDAKSPVSPKLTGPLSMYPPADDNYGEDSCSITTVGQNPAVVVIATSSAILYHCLLLPGQDESEIIPEKRENSYALYVTEAVELNIEEQANNQQYQYSYPVHLYPLSENSNSYACVHFAGVHVVTLNIIEHLKDYLLAEEHEIETILSSLCLARSAARYMVRTRRPAAPRDPAAPIAPATPLAALAGLAAAPPPLPMLLVLAADGAMVTRTLEPFDLEEQLYKELQLKNPALEQDDIQNILKERQKLSFSKVIQEMLTREVSQPILHTNKNEEPSPKESLEFVTQATLKLRQEYLARQARAGEAVRKKVAGLRALAARQDQWCEELKRELDEVQVESAVLREKCFIAEQHQDNLKLRCSSVVRAFSASSSASPAERELLRDLHSYRERSDEFNRQIQALKDRARVKEQQMKQWREDYKKKDIALGKSHSDTISSILQQQSHALDERFLYSQSEVRRVHWHPTSLSHVLVLVSDNTIRLYNIALKSGPKLVRIFTTGPKPACQIAGRRILDSLGDTVVDFTPAPGSDCLLLLRGNGDVYVIEASLDAKSPVSPKLTGPLSMYPPADDNYGEDSCSITTVGQNPAVVVIATSSAILYHCLLLPGQDESEIIPEKRENSYALYVTEAVELNIEEQATNQQYQYSYPVHLYPLSENSNSYACVHFAGVHVVTLNIIEHLKDYLLAEEHEIETILSSLCLARSAARYMVRTRRPAATRDPTAPVAPTAPLAALAGLAAAPPPLPMLLVLAADGALVTRTLEPFDLEEQLYKELQLKNPALEQDDIQNILKERQKLSFSKIIQEMLTREVSQPILHTNKNEEPSPKESLEFVTQATLKLRQEYLARQARAGEAVRKKVAGLRALAARQDQWCEELKRELDEVQVESAVLREKCSIAEQHQDNLKLRCSSVVRAFSASSSASPAERELLRDLHSYRERSDEFNRQIQALKDRARVKEQQMKQWREDYKKKDIALGKSHSDTISSILQQQTSQISELIEQAKLLKDQLSIV